MTLRFVLFLHTTAEAELGRMQQELVAAREAASERQTSLETTRAAEAELQSALAHARAQLSDERGASMRLARCRRRH